MVLGLQEMKHPPKSNSDPNHLRRGMGVNSFQATFLGTLFVGSQRIVMILVVVGSLFVYLMCDLICCITIVPIFWDSSLSIPRAEFPVLILFS